MKTGLGKSGVGNAERSVPLNWAEVSMDMTLLYPLCLTLTLITRKINVRSGVESVPNWN